MIALDVDVLVQAHNAQDPRQLELASYLEGALTGEEPVGLASVVLSGFVRILTHPRVLRKPVSPQGALDSVARLLAAPRAVRVEPGARHWSIFDDLCRRVGARGDLVPDAYLAALAVEHGCTWVSSDRGFARFPGLRWRHPLDGVSEKGPSA